MNGLDIAKAYDAVSWSSVQAMFESRQLPKALQHSFWRIHGRRKLSFRTTNGAVAFSVTSAQGIAQGAPEYRRELLALAYRCYMFTAPQPEHGYRGIAPDVRDELLGMALALPIVVADLRAPVPRLLWGTDARLTHGAATMTCVPEKVARALYRMTEQKGAHTYLERIPGHAPALERLQPRSHEICDLMRSLQWEVAQEGRYRRAAHISWQELRAAVAQVRRLAAQRLGDLGTKGPLRQLLALDSTVCAGALAKGRSRSFKIKDMLRAVLPWLILGDILLGVFYVHTESNPADHPSHGREIPPPEAPPPRAAVVVPDRTRSTAARGIELFAGSQMMEPWDIGRGPRYDIRSRELASISCALAPPCSSFSTLGNLARDWPLRSMTHPEGDSRNPRVREGNELARMLLQACRHVCIEHPHGSVAWRLECMHHLQSLFGLRLWRFDWCAYAQLGEVLHSRKPTCVLSSLPLGRIAAMCPGDHEHRPALRGRRAAAAVAYPWAFCQRFAALVAQEARGGAHSDDVAVCGAVVPRDGAPDGHGPAGPPGHPALENAQCSFAKRRHADQRGQRHAVAHTDTPGRPCAADKRQDGRCDWRTTASCGPERGSVFAPLRIIAGEQTDCGKRVRVLRFESM